MRLNKVFILLLLLSVVVSSFAQKGGAPPNEDEEDYYLFPVNPGERGSLAGTMGELRSTHFHTGIDIRTGGRIGVPILAAASGDIVRVAVSTSGYGNALYILHPNNTYTVYAHLDKFEGPIADYVRKQQYANKKWDIDLYPKKGQFTVNRGEIIALSGNSGSSGGPHLHFDLRDANHDLLNPLKYNFEEVWDNTPPITRSLAIKPMDKNARVDDEFARKEYKVRRIGNNYVIDKSIDVYGTVGLEVYAYDLMDNSRFRTGITEMELVLNGETVHRQEISTFSFSDQRNILVHMPYEELRTSGQRYHKLYVDDGNKLRIYDSKLKNGLTFHEDNCEHPVELIMKDTYNNVSKLSFTLQCKNPLFDITESVGNYGHTNEPSEQLIENTLKITVPGKREDQSCIIVYDDGEGFELTPDYISSTEATFLWDMRMGIPDSADYCGSKKVYNYDAAIPSEKEYHFYSENVAIHFPVNSLFDTLYLQTDYEVNNDFEKFSFGNIYQPLRRNLTVTLMPEKQYDPQYYSAYQLSGNNLSYEGGTWKDNTLTFGTRSFGTYTIAADSVKPDIRALRLTSNDLRFRISDKLSGIKEYELTINDEWVMMHYDYKKNLIWSEKLNDEDQFKGELKLVVSDQQGNVETFTTTI